MNADYGNWQKYQNPNPVHRWLLARFLHVVENMVHTANPHSILDVGCAEGFVMSKLHRAVSDAQIIGLDIDDKALLRGRKRGVLNVCQGSIYNLPFPDDSFDLVLALEVLEHLEKPEHALTELCRVSHHFCLLSVPHEPFFRGANFMRGKHLFRWGNDPEHLHNWSFKEFSYFIEGHGKVQQTRKPFPWSVALLRCQASSCANSPESGC